MKIFFYESKILYGSLIKWIFFASVTGVIVGTSTSIFLKLLDYSLNFSHSLSPFYFTLMPFAFLLSVFLVKTFAKDAEGHGTEKIIEAVHKKDGNMNILVVPVKLAATIITIIFGGSAGKEGPSAQIGAAIMSSISNLLKLSKEDRKKLVICGISAGFGAVFGTPISGAIFAIEVLFIGSILYEVLLPSFISAIISVEIAKHFGLHHHTFKVNTPNISDAKLYLLTILAGIIFSLIGYIFILILEKFEHISHKYNNFPYRKAIIASVIIVIIGLVGGKDSLGLSTESMYNSLNGNLSHWYTPFLKIITTSLTLGFGGSGGILTPIFVVGSTSGGLIGYLFNSDIAFFAGLGLVSLLAGTANTPLAAILMSIELFGVSITPFASLCSIISFILIGHRSVYPTQILSMNKSTSFDMKMGEEIKNTRLKKRRK